MILSTLCAVTLFAFAQAPGASSPLLGAGDLGRATITSPRLTATIVASQTTVSPGGTVVLHVEVVPAPGIHVYAPTVRGYRPLRLVVNPAPWLKIHAPEFPPSELYEFKPLREIVPVYTRPFRVNQPLTFDAVEARRLGKKQSFLVVTGALEYQACDDAVCYKAVALPFMIELTLAPAKPRTPVPEAADARPRPRLPSP